MKLREPINALTHLIGGGLGILGTILIIIKSVSNGSGSIYVVGTAIFGLSIVALYFTSGIYHSIIGSKKIILLMKKMDHSMIFVLIAGTYTPILLRVTEGTFRIVMLSVIWGMAILGILFRIFWINAPRWLYTLTYVVMGWISVIIIKSILTYSGLTAVILLAIGGILYTVGAVIYGLKKPSFGKYFGFHEIFHLFIIGGTFLHYIMVFNYIA